MSYTPRIEPGAASIIATLSARDMEVVSENILDVLADPRAAGHPSGLRVAKRLAFQHVCPHSWVILYRWQGCDPSYPHEGTVAIEGVKDRF